MSNDRRALKHSEACVFACLRMALSRPLAGDIVEFHSTTASVTDTHADRFISVATPGPPATTQRVLLRDIRMITPSGRALEATATRLSAQILSRSQPCSIDSRGAFQCEQRHAPLAHWQQYGIQPFQQCVFCNTLSRYHLIQCGCSDTVSAATRPVRLIVEAQGKDQVWRACGFYSVGVQRRSCSIRNIRISNSCAS